MKKTLHLFLISILGIASIYALIHFVKMDGFAFAWALNFLLMLCVVAFTEALKSPLTSSYYVQKEWEGGGAVYEHLGIHLFRKFLVWIGWEKLTRKSAPIERSTESLLNLHYQTKKAELGHLIILPIVMGFTVYVAFQFGPLKSLWLLVLNIVLNLYPIFLQRYNRPRIERALDLSKRRQLAG